MQPVFKNASVTRDDIGPLMRQYAEEHDILSKPRDMLVGSFRGVNFMLATPLLRWYLAHGLVVGRVYQIIEYEPNPCFRRFGESVSTARRTGDEDPDKANDKVAESIMGVSVKKFSALDDDGRKRVAWGVSGMKCYMTVEKIQGTYTNYTIESIEPAGYFYWTITSRLFPFDKKG